MAMTIAQLYMKAKNQGKEDYIITRKGNHFETTPPDEVDFGYFDLQWDDTNKELVIYTGGWA